MHLLLFTAAVTHLCLTFHCSCIRGLCSNEMHTGLYLVRATALKKRLETAADTTADKLLDQIQTMARDSNDHICETYTQMAAGVSVVGPAELQLLFT